MESAPQEIDFTDVDILGVAIDGQDKGEADANFAEFASVTEEALAANQASFDESMSRARGAMSGLQIGSLVALTLMAALAVYGLQLRINEYR